jgi:hypothetical protein
MGAQRGEPEGTRTPDPALTSGVLYQLSYIGLVLQSRGGPVWAGQWAGLPARRCLSQPTRLRSTKRLTVPEDGLPEARNEGVPGSSPGVGSKKSPAEKAFCTGPNGETDTAANDAARPTAWPCWKSITSTETR